MTAPDDGPRLTNPDTGEPESVAERNERLRVEAEEATAQAQQEPPEE